MDSQILAKGNLAFSEMIKRRQKGLPVEPVRLIRGYERKKKRLRGAAALATATAHDGTAKAFQYCGLYDVVEQKVGNTHGARTPHASSPCNLSLSLSLFLTLSHIAGRAGCIHTTSGVQVQAGEAWLLGCEPCTTHAQQQPWSISTRPWSISTRCASRGSAVSGREQGGRVHETQSQTEHHRGRQAPAIQRCHVRGHLERAGAAGDPRDE
jgi:hypothetical protein